MKKVLVILIVVIFAAGISFVLVNNRDSSEPDSASTNQTRQQESDDNIEQPEEESTDSLDPNNYTAGAAIGDSIDATDQSQVTVSINDNIFETTYLKIKKGTKVSWVNNGNMQHDVTSASSSPKTGLNSGLLNNGETYEFTFDETGVYEYFCTPHPAQMRGVITVVE